MSRRKAEIRERYLVIAADIEADWPEHAAFLRARKIGRSGERQANGLTKNIQEKAENWIRIVRKLVTAKDFWTTHDATRADEGMNENKFDDFLNLTPNWNEVRHALQNHMAHLCAEESFESLWQELQRKLKPE